MRIVKFNESVNKQEIDELLLDFKDAGYEIESDIFEGVINIKGSTNDNIDRIEFLQEVINLNSRVVSLGYESVNEKLHVYTGYVNEKPECRFLLKFKDKDSQPNKDVNSFEDFKTYLEKHLDLKFYEWDTEVYIPDLEVRRVDVSIKLDVTKEKNHFFIVFEKGGLGNIQSDIDISDVVMTSEEWQALNLWSALDSEKERLLEPELQKRAKSKVFSFDKKGIEAVEKCVNAVKR